MHGEVYSYSQLFFRSSVLTKKGYSAPPPITRPCHKPPLWPPLLVPKSPSAASLSRYPRNGDSNIRFLFTGYITYVQKFSVVNSWKRTFRECITDALTHKCWKLCHVNLNIVQDCMCACLSSLSIMPIFSVHVYTNKQRNTHIYTCTCEGEGALVHLFIYRIMHINSHLLFSPSIQPSTGLTMHIFIYPLSQLQIQHNDMYSDKGTPINQRHSSRHASLHKHNQAFRLCYQTWNW